MKRIALLMFGMWCMLLSYCPREYGGGDIGAMVILHVSGPIDESLNGGIPHAPMRSPAVYLDGHTLSVSGAHPDYIVRIVDDNEEVVYETLLSSGASSAVLPSVLSGEYQIQLIWNNWLFYGWITL